MASPLQSYASLVPYFVGIRDKQPVYIYATSSMAELVELIADEFGSRGHETETFVIDPARGSLATLHSRQVELSSWAAKVGAAAVRIDCLEAPDYYSPLSDSEKLQFDSAVLRVAGGYRKLLMGAMIQRCVIAGATKYAASQVFPKLPQEKALEQLWADIFDLAFLGNPDPISAFLEFDESLERVREKLQQLNIQQLRFSGPDTDLSVYLSERAIWLGGRKVTTDGTRFYANIPIGEIFTTPEAEKTAGTIKLTLPTLIADSLVENAKLTFNQGQIVEVTALRGGNALREFLATDPGAAKLGEVALVSMDSPCARKGRFYREILLDEKARSHIAVGEAYTACIRGGHSAADEELQQLQVNRSSIHHDMMVGSEQVSVDAVCRDGRTVRVIDNGYWGEVVR